MGKENSFHFAGQRYLLTSKLLLDKMAETNNPWPISDDKDITEDEYNRRTEYSDFNIILPTLFNFYHGLELLIKGMIYTFSNNFETGHDFNKLFNKLKELDQSGNQYINIIGKYVEEPIKIRFLNDFMQREKINNIRGLYMAFRYPANTKFQKFYDYLAIQYRGSSIVSEVREISKDIDGILTGAVKGMEGSLR